MNREFSIKNLDPYEGVSEEELCVIAPSAVDRTLSRGTILYDPLHPAPGVYVVKSGEVELSHSTDGKVTVFDTLGPGAVFGDFDTTGSPPSHTATTTRPTLLCITPIDDYLRIITIHPELMLRFMRTMAARIREYEQRLRGSHASARERVYAELVRLHEQRKRGILAHLRKDVRVSITHASLAKRAGLNRVTVTRALASLKDDGIVREVTPGSYEL